MPVCMFVCVCLSVCLSVAGELCCQPVCLSVSQSVSVFVCVPCQDLCVFKREVCRGVFALSGSVYKRVGQEL